MSEQSQISFPLTALTVGVHGPFTSGLLPSSLAAYSVDLINDSSWPASGDVCAITVEQSNNSGNTWAFDGSITLTGGQWKTRQGVNSNTSGWIVQFDNQGSATRKVRVTLNVLQACKLGATLSSL
jgi:hypothetical protein